jgi:Na+/phosphate symporter
MERTLSKGRIEEIHDLSVKIEEVLSLLYNAFIYNRQSFLREATAIIDEIKKRERELTEYLISMSDRDDTARLYAPIPSHLGRIAGNLELMHRAVETKVNENLLFSDKAVSEMNFLFNRTKEVITNLSDLLLARNRFLANYIIESEKEIERTATEFATLHEERLIEGLCLPKSSGVYVMIVDSIKRIVWNAKEIAEKLAK